jgi:hypothetical protein
MYGTSRGDECDLVGNALVLCSEVV